MNTTQPELAALLAQYFAIDTLPGQRWQRSIVRGTALDYSTAETRVLTVADLHDYSEGRVHFALSTGADKRVSWLGIDVDTREVPPILEAVQLIEDETMHKVLVWDSGNKGYHLAVCFDEADYATAKRFVALLDRRLSVLKEAAQRTKLKTGQGDFAVTGPGGSLLTLPCGIHPITQQKMSVVVPYQDQLVPQDDAGAIDWLRALLACRGQLATLPMLVPVAAIATTSSPIPSVAASGAVSQRDPNFFYSYRPCMDHLCTVGADRAMSRHKMTLAVIGTVKANPAIPSEQKAAEVERIIARNQGQLIAIDSTSSTVDYAVAEARRQYAGIDAPVSPSCFHKLHKEVAFAVAADRPEMCLTCRFNEMKRRTGEGQIIGQWNTHLFTLGIFAHFKAKRPGLGLTAGALYMAMITNAPLYTRKEEDQGDPVVWFTVAKLKELTGISGDETISRNVKKLCDNGLVVKVPKRTGQRRGNHYTIPELDSAILIRILTRLRGTVTPQMVAIDDIEDAA